MPIVSAFGGQRLIGFIDRKPLIAKFRLDNNSFEVGFNQNITDKEYAGKFDSSLFGKNFELLEKRYSAPLGKPFTTQGVKGTATTINTLPWIAALIDTAESEMGVDNNQISKELFEKIAQAIYTSNAFHRPYLDSGLITYLDISKQFNLSSSREYTYTEKNLNRLFSQYSESIKAFSNINLLPHSHNLFEQKVQAA